LETAAEPVPEKQIPPASSATPSVAEKTTNYKSVLDFFREYTGKRNLKAFVALFDKASIRGVRQEPAVALSDGKTKVKLFVLIPSTGKEAPNFAVKNAKLISLKPDGNAWVIETLPDEKTYDSSVTVLDNGLLTRIPLTIAPPIEMDVVKVHANGDNEIMPTRRAGTAKDAVSPKKIDAVRNYVDDYIFTANYIVRKNSTVEDKKDVKYQVKSLAPQGH
jgi:hypothetical protein